MIVWVVGIVECADEDGLVVDDASKLRWQFRRLSILLLSQILTGHVCLVPITRHSKYPARVFTYQFLFHVANE